MPVALVFPGQGSQLPGMGAPWRASAGWQLVDRASDRLDRDCGGLLLDAGAEQLRQTRNAQLSTLLVSLLALRALRARSPGSAVSAVAGHSLGELAALVAAEVLSEDDAVWVVAERREAMQAAADARPGTMAAVLGLEREAVDEVCADVPDVWPANDNALRHVVVSGSTEGVPAGTQALRAAGARRVLPLPVGGAFHTPLMAPARPRLLAALASATWAPPSLPVLSNVTGRAHDGDVAARLSEQLTAPVLWRQCLARLGETYGVDTVVEVGPGAVLTGLVRRTLPDVCALCISSPDDLEQL